MPQKVQILHLLHGISFYRHVINTMTSECLNLLDLSWSWGKNLDSFIVGKLNILKKIST